MKPVLFAPNATTFNTNGIGVLSDAVSCTVTEVRNGLYELTMKYPVTGNRYSDISEDCIVVAKPNQNGTRQPFRIYSISKPTNGVVEIGAEHISYQLSSIPVSGFTASTVSEALAKLKSNSLENNPFTFMTDKTTKASYSKSIPLSARSILGGVDGSILDVYGGEFDFNGYLVRLLNERGKDTGMVIAYGKNLTGVVCDTDMSCVVTGVLGYWQTEEATVVGTTQYSDDQPASYKRVRTLDCSANFMEKPTPDQIDSYCRSYLKSQYQSPKVSISVSFVNLGDSEEYEQFKNLESVSLCDTVSVKHPLYGVDIKTKVVKTVYDVLQEKYTRIELGSVQANIAKTISDQQKSQSDMVNKSTLQVAIKAATDAITGNSGGYVVLNPPKNPQEILIMDTDDINTATHVWRWNSGGLGYSSTGYNGPYGTAMTMDGRIVADFITAGTLQGIKIVGDYGSIGGFTMSNHSLSADWTYTYPDFTQADIDKAQAYILGTGTLTDAEKAKYDVDFNGVINSADLRVMQQLILGTTPKTITGVITIGSNDATSVVNVVGTSGRINGKKMSIGIGGLIAGSATLDLATVDAIHSGAIQNTGAISTKTLTVSDSASIPGYFKTPVLLLNTGNIKSASNTYSCNWSGYRALIVVSGHWGNPTYCTVLPVSDFATTYYNSSTGEAYRIIHYFNSATSRLEIYQVSSSQVNVLASGSDMVNTNKMVKIWGV